MLYFPAFTGTDQTELWRSDGTTAGTFMVKDINPGGGITGGSWPKHLTVIGTTLFFTAFDINDPSCGSPSTCSGAGYGEAMVPLLALYGSHLDLETARAAHNIT